MTHSGPGDLVLGGLGWLLLQPAAEADSVGVAEISVRAPAGTLKLLRRPPLLPFGKSNTLATLPRRRAALAKRHW